MLSGFLHKIRKAETPLYRRLKNTARMLLTAQVPVWGPFGVAYRAISGFLDGMGWILERAWVFLYRSPVFRSRCASTGERLYLERQRRGNNHADSSGFMKGHSGIAFGQKHYLRANTALDPPLNQLR